MTGMADLREDRFLDGRLTILQPARGYRSGADAVMLAAACPVLPGESVLELGCGAGVASLCLGWRVRDLVLTGIERQPDYAELARRNANANGIALEVLAEDLAALSAPLRQRSFDHVIANPPYFLGGTAAPDSGRAGARHEETPLAAWIDLALRRLRPGGGLTLIQKADRLDQVIAALQDRAGALAILPVAARQGREAGRVIVTARKGARTPMRLLAPFIMHEAATHLLDGEDLSPEAQAVLRHGVALTRLFAKVP
jgi:tRNA1(Val) A37 N6-methylase TrmN6